MKKFISFILLLLVSDFCAANQNAALNTHSGWVTLDKIEKKDDYKLFRRYSYLPDGSAIPNTIIYNCSKNPDEKFSHLTIIIPSVYAEKYDTDNNGTSVTIKIRIDRNYVASFNAEYTKNEIFIDEKENKDFSKLLSADVIEVSPYPGAEPFAFYFTEKMDSAFQELFQENRKIKNLGKIKHYSRIEMENACQKYQQAGK
jgi:hypothetical protein